MTISIGVLNPDSYHPHFRLRATKCSMDKSTLEEFQQAASLVLGVKGRIVGPFGDGRYRLQYYAKDAEVWARSVDFFETERGLIYKELTEERDWIKQWEN